MTVKKIYVHLIDGTDVWVPVDAIKVNPEQFEILAGDEYTHIDDPNYFFEFYPGDLVELSSHTFSNGKKEKVAKKLIRYGQSEDRKLNEFKFKATKLQLKFDRLTANMYRKEIERIKQQHAAGHVFYPAILETVEKLESLIKK
ncbi:hypothetical protein [Salinimicrobium gaetbulicola]|uniref:Uncharacterized protein n=1 Tax=Salinimicrobium gaetbulicola TaxID=999702 RepID=A0ABW3IBB6_9FLAO